MNSRLQAKIDWLIGKRVHSFDASVASMRDRRSYVALKFSDGSRARFGALQLDEFDCVNFFFDGELFSGGLIEGVKVSGARNVSGNVCQHMTVFTHKGPLNFYWHGEGLEGEFSGSLAHFTIAEFWLVQLMDSWNTQ